MKCVSPVYLPNQSIWVPCGKCNFCLKSKRAAWSHRLYQELKGAESAAFVTFTYADENLVYDVGSKEPGLEKTHMQDMLKRVRYYEAKRGRKSARYYLVGEFGGVFGRPHYHALLFNLHQDTLGKISDIWGKGHVHHGKVEPASIAYVSGYVINKVDEQSVVSHRTFPFALMSKGIGRSYLTTQMRRWHKRRQANYAMQYGYHVPLARYYKDKIFTKLEKEVMTLALDRELDKKFRDELERLTALHHDPYGYYQEKVNQAYSRVRTEKV